MEKIDKLLICRKMNSLGTDIYFEILKNSKYKIVETES
jgi:hypothetical protein